MTLEELGNRLLLALRARHHASLCLNEAEYQWLVADTENTRLMRDEARGIWCNAEAHVTMARGALKSYHEWHNT